MCFKITLLETKQVGNQQKFTLIFLLKLFCFFASKFKATENLKATVLKETAGFDIWMATI